LGTVPDSGTSRFAFARAVPGLVHLFLRSFLIFLPWLVLVGLGLNIRSVFQFGLDLYSAVLFGIAVVCCLVMILELRIVRTLM
jgi:hypothetical protein